ncbi:hypothetical protein F5Y13DRAFT_197513 [Hypoxylon sp. FL1857]|nr:hypothetical protein F5Y13DRAFT_197513 [Hypoxylon sp. FL1857]
MVAGDMKSWRRPSRLEILFGIPTYEDYSRRIGRVATKNSVPSPSREQSPPIVFDEETRRNTEKNARRSIDNNVNTKSNIKSNTKADIRCDTRCDTKNHAKRNSQSSIKNNTKKPHTDSPSHVKAKEHSKKTVHITTPGSHPGPKPAEAGKKKEVNDLTDPFVKVYCWKDKAMSTMSDSSDDSWNSDEDGMLCLMHQKGCNWVDIASTLERRKGETRKRYKYLSAMAEEGGLSVEILANLYEEDLKREEKYKSLKRSTSNASHKSKAPKSPGVTKGKGEGKGKKMANNDNNNTRTSGKHASSSKDKGKDKDKDKKKQHKHTIPLSSSSSSSSSSSNDATGAPSPSPSPSSSSNNNSNANANPRFFDFVDSLCRQYPDRKKLTADEFYSERDVKALSVLEARYRTDKWLYIAADFTNVTGRIVDPELLKYKFESGN